LLGVGVRGWWSALRFRRLHELHLRHSGRLLHRKLCLLPTGTTHPALWERSCDSTPSRLSVRMFKDRESVSETATSGHMRALASFGLVLGLCVCVGCGCLSSDAVHRRSHCHTRTDGLRSHRFSNRGAVMAVLGGRVWIRTCPGRLRATRGSSWVSTRETVGPLALSDSPFVHPQGVHLRRRGLVRV
jgi:hypothetical protein